MNKEPNAQALLQKAAPLAVQVLSEMLTDDSLPNPLRADIAKEILNRTYGKALSAEKELPTSFSIVMCDEVKKLSK